jgi:hypothetical protein
VIELTEEQRKSVENGNPVRVYENGNEYVVLRPDVYDRLMDRDYDNGHWSADELDRLREEAVSMLDNFGESA